MWSKQVAGRDDVLLATGAVNAARNSLTRKSGFSPQQWVLGKSIRLPSDLMDGAEVSRIGAMAAPGTRFHRKNELRMAAGEAYMKVAKRAELNCDKYEQAEDVSMWGSLFSSMIKLMLILVLNIGEA